MSEEAPPYRIDATGLCPFCRVYRNVGYNDGEAAGQTIMHFQVPVLPRYQGDVLDPRGGIRCVLPDEAAYWLSIEQ